MAIPGIQEIQTLATKYSKTQLQKMAQMGLIDTTKAVMAGMMIDRISKQNMTPPVTTVAEDALTPPQAPPQAAPQGPPQMGPGGAPPERSAGIAALQSNIPEMAGGGIVAFADGGEAPGYADGKLIDMRTDPERKISTKTQNLRDADRYQILAEELRDEQAKEAKALGVAKLDHSRNIEALQREMRRIKPAPSESNIPISSAAASEVAGASSAPVLVNDGETSCAFGRAFRGIFPGASEHQKAAGQGMLEGNVAYDKQIGVLKNKIANLGGPLVQQTPQQQAEYEQAQKDLSVLTEAKGNLARDVQTTPYYKGLPPIDAPKKVDAAKPPSPEVFKPKTEVAPPADQNVPMIRKERGAPEEFTKIDPEQIAVPEATSLKAERERREGAYSEAGVDTNMYKEMMAEVASRKEGGAKKREQALGMALMMTGLGLVGARRGQEFQTLSGAGRQALAQFQGTMDNIVANEDKLDNMVRELKMAENNYKKTGAESDLSRVRDRENKIEAIGIKNMELKNAAKLESAKLAVTKYGYSKPAPVVEAVNEILKDMPPGTPFIKGLEAYNLSQNISKPQNRLSYEEAAKIVSADVTIPAKDKPAAIEAMLRDAARLQGGAGNSGSLAPGKDGTFNYVPGGK